MAVWNFITGEGGLSYRDKIKERYVPKLEFDEAITEAFTKFVQGIFDELEVEGFLRERFTNATTSSH